MRKKITVLTILLLICTMVTQVMADQETEGNLIEVTGDEFLIDTGNQFIDCIGNVLAYYQNYEIRSQKLYWDQSGSIVDISGDVYISGDKLIGSAQNLKIDLKSQLITMTGEVNLRFDGQSVVGSVVTFDLQTNVLKATNAKISIKEMGK